MEDTATTSKTGRCVITHGTWEDDIFDGQWNWLSDFEKGIGVPVLVWGVLEGEEQPDAHEAYLNEPTVTPNAFKSVRSSEIEWQGVEGSSEPFVRKLDISNVTHWMTMPGNPDD